MITIKTPADVRSMLDGMLADYVKDGGELSHAMIRLCPRGFANATRMLDLKIVVVWDKEIGHFVGAKYPFQGAQIEMFLEDEFAEGMVNVIDVSTMDGSLNTVGGAQ